MLAVCLKGIRILDLNPAFSITIAFTIYELYEVGTRLINWVREISLS